MATGTAEEWRRLEALFVAALDLPASERADFVARETAHSPLLARTLAGMLARSDDAPARLSAIVGAAADRLIPHPTWLGRRFGPYRIVREIGRGGMGLVFEAVRDDAEYDKRVALKVSPWWRDTVADRERFRAERQILAALEHPHIARFLDGGTEDGVPYFAMEYVQGQTITAFCEQRHLDVRARLALFRQVCQAVHAAHQQLVVHRDLKPANILVDEHGAPKLLDFGIAKLLDPLADGAKTLGEAAWTPDYTSPEQVRGRVVTTRTDVYSLGLILYELLTDARAQIADQSSAMALDRSVCETEPMPPSQRAAVGGLSARARVLRGDLDTIVMMAVSKEPERRYGSVEALDEDIARYLEGQPVRARAATLSYRTGKFLRRHVMPVSAAALLMASLAAGVVSTLYQARRAEHRFAQVRALANAFVFEVHDKIESLPGATEARKTLVSTALTYLESLRPDAADDVTLVRELAAAYERIGSVQGSPLEANLGDTAGALVSYGSAADLLTPLAARGDRQAMQQLASVSRRAATVHQAKGESQAAIAAFDTASAIAERLLLAVPDDREALSMLSQAASDKARLAFSLRDMALADRSGEQAIQSARRLAALDPASAVYADTLATALNARGSTLDLANRLEEAAPLFHESIAIRERLVADAPLNQSVRRSLMVSYGTLADLLGYRRMNLGDRPGALAAIRRAVALADEALAADRADRRAQFDVASARLRLGSILGEEPPYEPAIDELRAGQGVIDALLAHEPSSDRYGTIAVVTRVVLGEVLARAERWVEAGRVMDEAITLTPGLLTGTAGPGVRFSIVRAQIVLARVRAEVGDRRAWDLAEDAARGLSGAPTQSPVAWAVAQSDLAGVYLELARRRLGDLPTLGARAISALESSATLWREAPVPRPAEPRRMAALAAIDANLAAARRLK